MRAVPNIEAMLSAGASPASIIRGAADAAATARALVALGHRAQASGSSKTKAAKTKAEIAKAHAALAGASLAHARVAARRHRPERARAVSPVLAKLGVDGAMLKRHAARDRLEGIAKDADASAVRFFARRGVDERTARGQAKACGLMDLASYRNLVERGERFERTG